MAIFALTKKHLRNLMRIRFGEIAQPVEQRPEKPCVPSSILGLATTIKGRLSMASFFFTTYEIHS